MQRPVSSKRIGEYAVLVVETIYCGAPPNLHSSTEVQTPLNAESAEPSGVQPSGGAKLISWPCAYFQILAFTFHSNFVVPSPLCPWARRSTNTVSAVPRQYRPQLSPSTWVQMWRCVGPGSRRGRLKSVTGNLVFDIFQCHRLKFHQVPVP